MKTSRIKLTAENRPKSCPFALLLMLIFVQGSMALRLSATEKVVNPKDIQLATLQLDDVRNIEKSVLKEKSPEIKVVRTVNRLWQLELPDEHLPAITTQYIVTGTNGKADVFSSINNPSSSVKIEIKPKGIRSKEYVNNHWLMSESVDIIIYPLAATSKGAYKGIIKTIISFAQI